MAGQGVRGWIAAAVIALGGCGGVAPSAVERPDEGARAPSPARRIVDGTNGERVQFVEMVRRLSKARAVYMGERHDVRAHHEMQLAVLRALHGRHGSVGVGMEMFQRPFQAPLDAYVAGEIGEAELKRRTEYEQRWGHDWDLYRPVLRYAREHRLPVVALNARQEITRTVAQQGLDALEPDLRKTLPELDRSDGKHRRMVLEALKGHPGMDEGARDRFYLAQLIWDETMASEVARAVEGEAGVRTLVVLAGTMHVRAGLGIPKRAARRGAEPYRIVLPVEDDEALEQALSERPAPADFLWIPRAAADGADGSSGAPDHEGDDHDQGRDREQGRD
jgi:uncharacterized iron-regulated protein